MLLDFNYINFYEITDEMWKYVFNAIEKKPMYYIYEKTKKYFAVIRDRET